ncbi:armadillo-type protein [Halteromyces radiatus]|uniref:armadillo-type protein n=1 Tax=Halteromyces radiatus TaxID=101107 RepID=UPI00221F87AD|nr:armadillo-type protein [Halteromyces radiatus]KAI8090033.1 armadillo-type protein [Halteromyces radiatus]
MNNVPQTLDVSVVASQFEEACSDFQIPATRAAAEHILTAFRQIPKVLPICRYILDHTTSPMVQFQVALAIGEVAVRDYSLYSLEDIVQLKNYLIEYCLHHEKAPKYVRDQLLSSVSLITKRSLFDFTDQDKQAIIVHIKQLLAFDTEHAQVLGVALANALTDQFSSMKSLVVGLNWEFHHKTKVFFELHMLYPLFQELATKLHTVVHSTSSPLSSPTPPLLSELLILAEKTMNWEFESTNTKPSLPGTFTINDGLDDDFEKENGPTSAKATSSNFPKDWLPVIGNNEVIWLFFMAYDLVKTDDALSYRCLQCLIKLAGLKEDFFNQDGNAIKSYATTVIHGIMKMMNSINNEGTSPQKLTDQGPQLLGTVQMVHRLLENISAGVLCGIPEFFQFLNEIHKLTLCCIHGTVSDIDEGWIGEASDECLQTWVTLADVVQPVDPRDISSRQGLSDADLHHLAEYLRSVAYQVVKTYMEMQLERAKLVLNDEDEEDEIESGIKDWDTYGDQLTCISTLGRLNPHQCLSHLQHLLSDRTQRFQRYFTNEMTANLELLLLHEQLHWIILMTAFVLADAGNGEQPMIPESIMQLSSSQSYEQDQIVQLSNQVLELLRFYSSFGPNTIEASNCSPRVAETLIWFMERWSKTYLLVNENDYGFMSPNIAKSFGQPGPSDGQGVQIIEFFIEQMKNNFMLWNADPDVLSQLVRWLNTCGTPLNLKSRLLVSPAFPELIKFITSNLEQLPEAIHNYLIQTVGTIASGVQDSTMRHNYLDLIFVMLEERLGAILHKPDFTQQCQQANVMNQVLNALDMFDGLALSCQFNNTVSIFGFTCRFFQSFHQLMEIYKNVPEVQLSILQILADLTERLDMSVLEKEQKQGLYQFIMEIIRLYGTFNHGKKRVHTQEEEADRPYEDICTILVLLINVMASEFEAKHDGNTTSNGDGLTPGVADVVLFGVNTIIPMIDMNMLQIPNLCQYYIKLVSHLIEQFPDKLAGLPTPLFDNLMASLDFGIAHPIADINILTLQAVTPLAMWAAHQKYTQGSNTTLKSAVSKLLGALLNVLLFQHLDASVVNAASDALLALMTAEHDSYMELVNQIITQQSSDLQPRLINAFGKLDQATPKQQQPTKEMAQVFKDNLLVLLMDVRAVLRVK